MPREDTDTEFAPEFNAAAFSNAFTAGLEAEDERDTRIDADEEVETNVTDEAEGDDEVDEEEVEETVAEDESDEGEEEDDEEEDESEVEAEEDDEVERRVLKLKRNHEEVEFDPFEDETRSAELYQKGLDYERKAGISQAVAEGLLQWDTAREGFVPGKTVTDGLQAAHAKGMEEALLTMEKAGLPVRNETGRFDLSQLVTIATTKAETDALATERADVERAEKEFTEKKDQEALNALIAARTKLDVAKVLHERDSVTASKTAKTNQQAAYEVQLKEAEGKLSDYADKLDAYFTDPLTKEVDALLKGQTLEHAKLLLSQTRDLTKAGQHLKSVAEQARARHKAALKRKAANKKKTRKSSPSAKGTKRRSSPSTRSRTGKKRRERQEVDPRDPFKNTDWETIFRSG